jgi:hypothetical protein
MLGETRTACGNVVENVPMFEEIPLSEGEALPKGHM